MLNKEQKFTFKDLFKRLSTWMAAVSVSASTTLTWYFTQPPEAQQHVPGWIIGFCVWISLMSAAGIPIATSYRQKRLKG